MAAGFYNGAGCVRSAGQSGEWSRTLSYAIPPAISPLLVSADTHFPLTKTFLLRSPYHSGTLSLILCWTQSPIFHLAEHFLKSYSNRNVSQPASSAPVRRKTEIYLDCQTQTIMFISSFFVGLPF